jgi:methionyl-tRNA synthetase
MYVWFDALVNYVSAVGWNHDMKAFDKWWVETGGVVQYCGKDNLRQQSAMWQAMLMAVGLPSSKTIIIDGFITGEGGVKMSKSLGNTVDPVGIVDEYGTDALRYFMAKELSPFEDSPFTMEKFKEAYNAGLANGVGNLTSRILKLTSTYKIETTFSSKEEIWSHNTTKVLLQELENYDIQKAMNQIWTRVADMDKEIQNSQPFKLLKSENPNEVNKGMDVMVSLYKELWWISVLLEPFLPETSIKMQNLVKGNQMPETPLFMRK